LFLYLGLNDQLLEMEEIFQKHFNLEELGHIGLATQVGIV
jgi:hypothetical protein